MGRFSRTETITHDLGVAGRLSLRTVNGDVRVRSVDGTVVTVHASYDVSGTQGSAGVPPESSPVLVRKGPGELSVETRNRIGGLLDAIGEVISRGIRTTVEFEVELPRGASLRLHGVSADLTVEGVRGTQEYHTVSGDVSIREAAGRISVHSVSGDVSMVDAGTVIVDGATTSGDIDISAQRFDRFSFTSVSGDIELDGELSPGDDYRVETVTGDLQLTTSSGVDLEASGPAVSVRVDTPHRSDSGRGRKLVVVGDGAARIRFRSMSGDVTISPPFGARHQSIWSERDAARLVEGVGSIADQVVRRAEAAGRRAEAMGRHWEALGRRVEAAVREGVGEYSSTAAPSTASASTSASASASTDWDRPPAAAPEPMPEPAGDEPIEQMAVLRALEHGEIDVAEASRLLSEAARHG